MGSKYVENIEDILDDFAKSSSSSQNTQVYYCILIF